MVQLLRLTLGSIDSLVANIDCVEEIGGGSIKETIFDNQFKIKMPKEKRVLMLDTPEIEDLTRDYKTNFLIKMDNMLNDLELYLTSVEYSGHHELKGIFYKNK